MAKDYSRLASNILEAVGGTQNVTSLTHCMTRLRFVLKDASIPDDEKVKKIKGVISVVRSGGQYQVVIGQTVGDVYDAVLKASDGKITAEEPINENLDDDRNKGNLLDRFISLISGIFMPVLSVMMAAGFIKGLNALLVAIHLLQKTSGTYIVLNAIGDGFFYFLPIILAYTSSKKFKLNPFTGMAIGAALVYPTLTTIMTGKPIMTVFAHSWISSNVYFKFLGLPVILMTYSSSVIPIILAVFFASKLEHLISPHIVNALKNFLVPTIVLLVTVPLTFLIIGPIATWLGDVIGQLLFKVYELNPIVAGLVLGLIWQVLVVFGLHWGVMPIAMNNVATMGYDPIQCLAMGTPFACAGAVLGLVIRSKDPQVKELGIPGFISSLFGVSEPSIYGLTLPRRKPFYATLIGAACGGMIMGFMGTKNYIMGGAGGILGFANYINPKVGLTLGFWGYIISAIVSFLVAFVLSATVMYSDKITSKQFGK